MLSFSRNATALFLILILLPACGTDPEPDRISLEFSKLRSSGLQREGDRLETEITRSERRIRQLKAELLRSLDEEAALGAELKTLRLRAIDFEAEIVERRLAEEAQRQSGGGDTDTEPPRSDTTSSSSGADGRK